MFSLKQEDSENNHANHGTAETIIGPSVKVEGTFQGQGDVIIEGILMGTLITIKDLTIGEQAKVEANVEAANMHISGEVHGNLKASGRIDLMATAKIYGDVESTVLSVASGAIVQGRCMSGKSSALSNAVATSEEMSLKTAKK